jgi:hypothetical protein
MKNRNRGVPPPPPPPTASRPARSMLIPRPRRIDIPGLTSRTDQQRRAVPKPAPRSDWLSSDIERADRRPIPARLPDPPENLGEVLRDLSDNYTRPVPPTHARARIERARPQEPKDSAKRLNIPVICTQADRPFVLVFRESHSIFGTRYKLDATLKDVGEGGEALPSFTVPVGSLDFGGIKCPHCVHQSRVRPIRCGGCGRLACDGRVKAIGDDLFFECAASCGTSGWVRGSLETVTGSEGGYSPSANAAGGFICGPAAPPGNVPKLPKPR